MKQDLEKLKARLNEARMILDLVDSSLDAINIETAPQEDEVRVGYLSMEQAYGYLNISRTKFYELRNQIEIPSFQVLGRQLYKREDLDSVMESLRV